MIKNCILGIALLASVTTFAQEKKWNFSLGMGYNFMSYMGDLNSTMDINKIPTPTSGFSLYVEKRLGHYVSVDLKGLFGEIAQRENSMENNLNFRSDITCFDADVYFHFDNDLILSRQTVMAPYLGVGVGYFMFDPEADLLDKNGLEYNYWSDGSIRNIAEPADPNALKEARENSVIVSKDYEYETQLTNPDEDYARSTYTIPLTVGIKFKFAEKLETRIAATFYMTGTDYLDNIASSAGNDIFYATAITLNYHFGHGHSPEEAVYDDVNFGKIFHEDQDNDGVQDSEDVCQNTPKGVKVDEKGCALDDDNDGVANYLDKEPNSVKGAVVDQNGKTLTDEMLETLAAMRDSVMTTRTTTFYEAPSAESLSEIDAQIETKRTTSEINHPVLPVHLRPIDTNNDGIIQSKEVTDGIDNFLDGSLDMTVEELYEMIDYFFEQ